MKISALAIIAVMAVSPVCAFAQTYGVDPTADDQTEKQLKKLAQSINDLNKKPASSVPTRFELIGSSLEDLLNNGGEIVSVSGNRSYIISSKNGYYLCDLDTIHKTSTCYLLNKK